MNHQTEESQNLDYAFLDDDDYVPFSEDSVPPTPFSMSQTISDEAAEASFHFANMSSTHFTPSPPPTSQRIQNLNNEIQMYLNTVPRTFKKCEFSKSILTDQKFYDRSKVL